MEDITVLLTLTSTYTMDSATSSTSLAPKNPVNYITTTLVTAIATMRSSVTELSSIKPSPSPSPSTSTSASVSTTITSASALVGHSTSPPSALPGMIDGIVSKDSSKSVQLGLALGIPIAVISLFGLTVFIFILMQKRKLRNKNIDLYPNDPNYTFDWTKEDLEASTNPSHPESFSKPSKAATVTVPKRNISQPSIKNYVKDRYSKVLNIHDIRDDISDSQVKPPQNFRDSLLSPIFLKRFKLSRNLPDNIKAQSAYVEEFSVPRDKKNLKLLPMIAKESNKEPLKETYIVIRSYEKNLKDELTVNPGSLVHILESFSDGWCRVELIDGGKGLVPFMCLQLV